MLSHFLRYLIRRRVTKASALESSIVVYQRRTLLWFTDFDNVIKRRSQQRRVNVATN